MYSTYTTVQYAGAVSAWKLQSLVLPFAETCSTSRTWYVCTGDRYPAVELLSRTIDYV